MSNCDVLLPGALHRKLYEHLFPGDGDEHGAVLAVSAVRTERGTRLLGQQLFCARDGVDYVSSNRGYRKLRAEFIVECLAYCRTNKLGYLAIHNHGGDSHVSFSETDIASHERGYPTLLDLAEGQPVGALVFARNAAAGDVWFPDSRRSAVRTVRVTDAALRDLHPTTPALQSSDNRYHRQVLMFGELGQRRLADCKVAVVGLGGVGSLLVELLARLGVGTLVLVDPDRVDVTNLSRVVGATRWDTRWPLSSTRMPTYVRRLACRHSSRKTTIATRVARQANPECIVIPISESIAKASAARACLDCDFLFLAADSMQARLVANAISQQYLIPGLQIGSKVVTAESGQKLEDAYSVVRRLLPGQGCLWCNGLIAPHRLAWEAKSDDERRAQQYGVESPNPSVITLNAVGAAHAASDFMTTYLGLKAKETFGDFRFHHLSHKALEDLPRQDPLCSECGTAGRVARGDSIALPVLI